MLNARINTITRKGQITIPAEMRRALDLAEGDKVEISLEGDGVRLRRGDQSVVAKTAGIIKADVPRLSAEEERRVAEEAIAGAALERLQGR